MTINPEARLKKIARASGFEIRKKDGGYIFAVDPVATSGAQLTRETAVMLGGHEKFCPTLQDVAKLMQRLHMLGR